MNRTRPSPFAAAAQARISAAGIHLSGAWTAVGLGSLATELDSLQWDPAARRIAECADIEAMDTAGAWVLQAWLQRLQAEGGTVRMQGLAASFTGLFEFVAQERARQPVLRAPVATLRFANLRALGLKAANLLEESQAMLSFVGECSIAQVHGLRHPARLRLRPILFNIRSAGIDALPIIGLLSFLLGIVVSYQSAGMLRQYGANVFIVDIIGVSMLREFAPLITAIIVAGRSGSAYAAQIGTMVVTEEVDALRTIGIAPLEMLVLPKVLALMIALPLLTLFADLAGVLGGMVMAQAQLGVGSAEFLDRFTKAVSPATLVLGLGKAPVFAFVIAVVGCFQGFRTRGGADGVGRQTTRSVVQAIFLVIVADGLFSVIFGAFDF